MALGCGGTVRKQGGDGAAGTANAAERKCSGTLDVLDKRIVELDCEAGVTALGGGMFRLMLASEQGDTMMLTLPSLETGSYTSGDCATVSVSLAGENGVYFGDELVLEQSSSAFELERTGDVLSGAVSGIFCDYVADNGSGMPGPLCVEGTLPNLRAPIDLEQRQCDCPTNQPTVQYCEPQACDIGRCYPFQCPLSAPVCMAP